MVTNGLDDPFVSRHFLRHFVLDQFFLGLNSSALRFVDRLLTTMFAAAEQALLAVAFASGTDLLAFARHTEILAFARVFYFRNLLDVALQMAHLAAATIAAAVIATIGNRMRN